MQIRSQIIAKFCKACRHLKTPVFEINMPNIMFDIILRFVNIVDGVVVNGEKGDLHWDAAMNSFDTSRENGTCYDWMLDWIVNNKQLFVYHDTTNEIDFRWCYCTLKYSAIPKAQLTIKGYIRHKSKNSTWQCPTQLK